MANSEAESRVRRLRAALDSGRWAPVKRQLAALNPAEVANLLASLPERERELVWEMVDPHDDGEVLLHLPEDVRDGLIRQMDTAELVAAAEELDIDDLADFVDSLPETVTRQVMRALSDADRARLEAVLVYAPDTAGGLMNTDTVTVRPDVSLETVMRYLRMRGELPAQTDALFVVDRYGVYLGRLPLDRILTQDPTLNVGEVMDRDTEALDVALSDREVAQEFESSDLISAAVVSKDRKLVGRITVDDVVDVIRADAEHNLLSMAGVDEDEDLFAPVRRAARRRALWLGINLGSAFLAATVVGLFEATIEQLVALAVLMPIVASMGGIAANQIVALMVRGIALGQVGAGNTAALLRKELLVAVINGLLWGCVVAGVTFWWFESPMLGLVIGLALLLNLLLAAAAAGLLVPLLLRRLGLDPALAGSVIVTTITDVMGFFLFLGLGTLILL